MVLSIIFVLFIYYPIIKEEINYRTTKLLIEKPASESFSLQIPSIKINVPVIKDVNPWNKNEYLPVLKNGVAHATGSAVPNANGSVFLFAHSSDFPWRMTRYNTAFFRLGRLKIGDNITITFEGEKFSYRVKEKKIVWPYEVEFLTNQNKNQLILQTCAPLGTSLKRLLIFAKPVNN